MPDKRELKSYVWHKDQCYFISTIERDSSAMVGPPSPRFHETIAWEYDWNSIERGKMIAQEGAGGAFEQHYWVCKQLFTHGEIRDDWDATEDA